MLQRFRPLTARLQQKASGATIRDVAAERIVFDEGRTWTARPILCPAGEADRIEGHHADSDPAGNLARIDCREVWQGASEGFLLEDAIIANGTILTRDYVRRITVGHRQIMLPKIDDMIAEAAMCSSVMSERYFGHWLHDQLPEELLASDMGLPALALAPRNRPHEQGYRDLARLDARKVDNVRVKRLWVFRDCEINDHRVARIRRVKSRIRGSVKGDGHSRVYLSRGRMAIGRSLVNEDEVIDALRPLGFEVVVPEQLTPAQIVAALSDASLVIGPEGSAFAHALFALPAGSTMIPIIGAQHFNMVFRIYCEALDLNYGFILARPEGEQAFSLDVSRLAEFVGSLEEQGYA